MGKARQESLTVQLSQLGACEGSKKLEHQAGLHRRRGPERILALSSHLGRGIGPGSRLRLRHPWKDSRFQGLTDRCPDATIAPAAAAGESFRSDTT